MTISDQSALRSLRGNICPSCGGNKRTRMTLCGGCYHRLPSEIRAALYTPIASEYVRHLATALTFLGVAEIKLPP